MTSSQAGDVDAANGGLRACSLKIHDGSAGRSSPRAQPIHRPTARDVPRTILCQKIAGAGAVRGVLTSPGDEQVVRVVAGGNGPRGAGGTHLVAVDGRLRRVESSADRTLHSLGTRQTHLPRR